MLRIERLTASQIADLPRHRDEWLRIGLSIEPTDRRAAEDALDLVYRCAGLNPPRVKIWLDSPLAGAVGAAILASDGQAQVGAQVGARVRAQVWDQVAAQVRGQVAAQVRDQVGAQVGAQVWDQVGAQVEVQVGAQVGDQVGAQVEAQVRDQVRDQVGAQVRDQVRDQVGDQVGAQVGDQVRFAIYGLHEAGWLSFYDFFSRHFGLAEKMTGLIALARTCGWVWPFADAAILTPRPVLIRRDEVRRLHCADGPAMAYPDGWSIWAWHGVRVAREIIEHPETISVASIDGERNAEIRRVMVDRFGRDRFMRDGGGRLVDQDGQWGTLWRRDLPDGPLQVLECINGTPEPDGSLKRYWLSVPPDVTTALQAVAWSYDVPPETYARLRVRT